MGDSPCDPADHLVPRSSKLWYLPDMASAKGQPGEEAELLARVSTRLMLATRVMEERKMLELVPFRLTVNQYSAMLWLRCNPGASNARVARWCHITPQAASTMLRQLESRGLIERGRSSGHLGMTAFTLSSSGIDLIREADAVANDVDDRLGAAFSVEEQEVFLSLLERAQQALVQPE